MASTLGTVQPFWYRGYVYDEETSLYYLRSRYFFSKWCRFINADAFVLVKDKLLFSDVFTYCCNQPIGYIDSDGYEAEEVSISNDDPVNDLFPTEGGGSGSQGDLSTSFNSYSGFKYYYGKAGSGNNWHHLVEQCQIKLSNFASKLVYSVNNTIALDASIHQQISAFYSSIQDFTNGLTVRMWLAGKPFDEQYAWGLKFLDKIMMGE